jgi:hypothetical protein
MDEIARLKAVESSLSKKIDELMERDRRWRIMLRQLYEIVGIKLPKMEDTMSEVVPIMSARRPKKPVWLWDLPQGAWFLAYDTTAPSKVIKDFILEWKTPEACLLYDGIEDKQRWDNPVDFSEKFEKVKVIAIIEEVEDG